MRKIYPAGFCRKSFFFLSLLLFSFGALHSQVDINIGTGTTGNTTTTYPCPLQDFYEGSRAQYLFLASELTAAGMTPGNITAIRFNVISVNTGTNPALEQYSISIGTTSTTSLTATSWEPGTVQVYGPVNYMASAGINTFTFTTPFLWNGSSNLIIEICNGDPANDTYVSFTNNCIVPWTEGLSFNGSHSYRADNIGNGCGTATTTNTGTQTTRPNITFVWAPSGPCTNPPVPGTVTANANPICPGTSLSLGLTGGTSGSGQTYQWQSSSDNTNWNNITGATLPSYTTLQTASTYYRCIVTCGVSVTSASLLVTTSPVTNCYCIPTYSTGTGSGDYCTLVQIPGTTLNNVTGASASPYYTLFPMSGTTTCSLLPGLNYSITLRAGTFGSNDLAAWIDYNQNGVFETSELLGQTYNLAANPATTTFNFTVPIAAVPGTVRLRVREADQATTALDP
ncbi:MAG TPA: GEVED domain-containing protein, partial [Chitinophagaceae bacterium]